MLSGKMKLELSAHKIPVMYLNNLLTGKLLSIFSNIPGEVYWIYTDHYILIFS